MLEKLTKQHETILSKVKDKWLSYFFSLKFDNEKAKNLINWIYTHLLKLPKPIIIILDSPIGCQLGANLLKDDQVWAQVRAQVRDQKMEYQSISYYLSIYDYDWLSFYDFFEKIGIVKSVLFSKYRKLLKCNIFSLIALKNIVFISKPPIFLKRNENNRMHSTDSKAIEFGDGWGVYYVEGIYFKEEKFIRYFKENPTAKEILEIKNQEQKAVVIKHIGWEKIFESLRLQCISQYITENGDENHLFKSEELPINLLKLTDTSTKTKYYLGVPSEQIDCLEAIAWTFGISKEEYENRIES